MGKKKPKKSVNPKKKFVCAHKKAFACVLAGFALALGTAAAIILTPPREFTVAFYRIEERQRKGISEEIKSIADRQNIRVAFREYSPEKPLRDQLLLAKKPNIILTTGGFALGMAVDSAQSRAAFENDFSKGMTASMRSAIRTRESDSKITAIPILSSHLEVDIDSADFRASSTKSINTWNDVEKFMREMKRKKEAPLIFAGGNPDTMLDIVGALAESLDGREAYDEAAQILKSGEKNPARLAVRLCDEVDSPLVRSVKLLSSWYKLGLMHPGVFSFQKSDVEAFASSRLSSVLFMSLETHRNFSQQAIARYTSVYFPSEHGANSRIFTGTSYYAVPVMHSQNNEKLVRELLSASAQENMSRSTGVAPVLAQCRTPDKQAFEARYWIASTDAPLAGLAHEAYLTKEQKAALSAEIASRIRN